MKIVETANYYMNIILTATILIVAVISILLYYLVKVKKVTAVEEKPNYKNFDRRSSMEYCRFDDIVSDAGGQGLSGAGMIVMDNRTFITGISIIGYNYEHASAGERERTMINAVAFANIIEQPIQMRQTVESIDIQYNIDQFIKARERTAKELIEIKEKYSELVSQAQTHKNEPEIVDEILKHLGQLDRTLYSLEWKIKEADNIIRYERILQEKTGNTDRINQIMFAYHYNPDEFTETLTKEEIFIKAMNALKSRISVYSSALQNCGCSCKPLTAEKIVQLIYRHMHPDNVDKVDANAFITDELSTLFVTSDSLYELEKERIGESSYLFQIKTAEEQEKKVQERAKEQQEAEIKRLQKKMKEYEERAIREEVLA